MAMSTTMPMPTSTHAGGGDSLATGADELPQRREDPVSQQRSLKQAAISERHASMMHARSRQPSAIAELTAQVVT
jgi:hypothetical protein